MQEKVRKYVYISPEQDERLKSQAKKLGVTEADLIRQGIDLVAPVPRFLLPDLRAWEDELAFIKERATLAPTGPTRTWIREDLYEEWLKGLPR